MDPISKPYQIFKLELCRVAAARFLHMPLAYLRRLQTANWSGWTQPGESLQEWLRCFSGAQSVPESVVQ